MASRSLSFRAVTGFGWMLSGAGVQGTLRLVLLLLLARLLGPGAVGLVDAALIVVHIALTLSNLGVPAAVAQRRELEQRHIDAAFWLALASGAATACAIAASAPLIERFFGFADLAAVTLTLAVVPLVSAFGIVPDGLLRRELRFRALALTTVVPCAFGYGLVGLGLACAGAGMWALVAAFVAEHALRAAGLLLARPHAVAGLPERGALREILLFSGGMTLRLIGHRVAEALDNVVVGRMLGAEALGLYKRSYQIVSVPPATIGRAMSQVMMPVMARVQDEPARLGQGYLRATGVIALVGLPGAALLATLAPDLIEAILGPLWLGTIVPLQILAAGVFLRMMLQLAEALGTAAGSVYAVAWRQAVYAGAVLAGALAGASWGLPGVATGVLAAQVLAYLLTAQLCLSVTGTSWRAWLAAHGPGVALALWVGAHASIATLLTSHWPPWASLGGSAVYAGLVTIMAYQAGWLGPDGNWLLAQARQRLPWKFRPAVQQ